MVPNLYAFLACSDREADAFSFDETFEVAPIGSLPDGGSRGRERFRTDRPLPHPAQLGAERWERPAAAPGTPLRIELVLRDSGSTAWQLHGRPRAHRP